MSLPDATFDVYFADHDALIECTANDEVEYDDPAEWPCYVDEWRWAITPDDDPAFEPAPDDVAWVNDNPLPEPFTPSDEDLEEMAAWSEHLDRVAAIRREDDAQAEARGRFG
jgi:hypothetical protein